MNEWHRQIQLILDEIDHCIKQKKDESVTLSYLSKRLGYSEYYISRKFSEITGMSFRKFLRCRTLVFALNDVRDTEKGILEIALEYGFSSNEAFSRSFKELYGVSPKEYRKAPVPVSLHTVIRPFDCCLIGTGGNDMANNSNDVKTYFVTIPAHKFLHIRNYESVGFYDFCQKQSRIKGQDIETVSNILKGIKGCLDDCGGNGQVMAYINEPSGRICSWGIPLAEGFGIRLPADYSGEVPKPLRIMDVPEGEYIVFENRAFDIETENQIVEQKMEEAMKRFDYEASGYSLDTSQGRVFYFFHDCNRFWKYIRPVIKTKK